MLQCTVRTDDFLCGTTLRNKLRNWRRYGYEDRKALSFPVHAGSLVYEARELDSRFLPEGFPEMSREWFAGITREKASASLTGKEDEIRMMADYAARFNLAYFSGTFREDDASWTEDPAYALWESHPESAFGAYMHLVMAEASGDNLRLECAPPVQGP